MFSSSVLLVGQKGGRTWRGASPDSGSPAIEGVLDLLHVDVDDIAWIMRGRTVFHLVRCPRKTGIRVARASLSTYGLVDTPMSWQLAVLLDV
jgi:hypothetical protein